MGTIAAINTRTRRLPRDGYEATGDEAIPIESIAQLEGAFERLCRRRYGSVGLFRKVIREMAAILSARGVSHAAALHFFEGVIHNHPDYWMLDDHRSVGKRSPREGIAAELRTILASFSFQPQPNADAEAPTETR